MYVRRSDFWLFPSTSGISYRTLILTFLILSFFHAICSYRKIVKNDCENLGEARMTLAKLPSPPGGKGFGNLWFVRHTRVPVAVTKT